MAGLRAKSVALTGYLEELLLAPAVGSCADPLFEIVTPPAPARGAQLSVRLAPGLLDGVLLELAAAGVVVDERRPDVVRVAPAPLYNTFEEVWAFAGIFMTACERVRGRVEVVRVGDGGVGAG
jgi:kynureninase